MMRVCALQTAEPVVQYAQVELAISQESLRILRERVRRSSSSSRAPKP